MPRVLVLLFACAFSGLTLAESYAHLGFGYSNYKADGDFLGSKSSDRLNSGDVSAVAGLGYRLRDRVGVEVSYYHFEVLPFLDRLLSNVDGYGLRWAATLQHPLPRTRHFVQIHGGRMNWKANIKPSVNHGTETYRGNDPFWGLSVRFLEPHGAAIILRYDRHQLEDIDLSFYSLALEIPFGG